MSTKTIKQRIALVAVTALTAGILSVVSAPASMAANNEAPGTATPVAAADTLNMATTSNTSGVAVLGNTTSLLSSVGLLATGDISGTRLASTTQTATLLSTGTLVVYTSQSATKVAMISVTGGRIVNSANSEAINSGVTSAAANGIATAANSMFAVAITPNTGATAMTVTLRVAATGTAAALIAGDTASTLRGSINVTIASSSVAGAVSSSTSGVFYDADGTAGNSVEDAVFSGRGSSNYDSKQYANLRVRDAYGTALGAGLLTATSTNGAFVNIETGDSTPVAITDFYTSTPDNTQLTVSAPSSAPVSTVVTIQYNGVTVGTKSFVFRGEVATITLSAPKNGLRNDGTAGSNTATVVFADSAGNALATSTANPSTAFITSTTSAYTLALSTVPTTSLPAGLVTWTCPDLSNTGNIVARFANASGTVITSNALAVSCSRIAYRYTAGYDKAVYAPGEIAILTVTFTDVDGRSAADSITTAADNATNVAAIISVSGVTKVGAADVADDQRTQNGKLTYSFIVGQTEGSFANSVSFPQVNTNGALQGVGAVTASITIKSATTATSNADVLKSIVALIASINKQIQALQKLILKR